MNPIWTKIVLAIQSQTDGGLIIIFLILFFVYILPWVIASSRGTRNSAQVRIINLFLWRSFIGRVIALAMAYSPELEIKQEINKK